MLEDLTLANCKKVTDSGLEALAPLRRLSHLNIAWCSNTTDKGLTFMAISFPALTILNAAYCMKLTDDGVSALGCCLRGLMRLNLTGCWRLTDLSLEFLGPLSGLTLLEVGGCTNMSQEAIDDFMASKTRSYLFPPPSPCAE